MSFGTFRKTVSMTLVTASLAVGGALVTTTQAEASAGYCTTTITRQTSTHVTKIPATRSGNTDCTLKRGTQSPAVKALQQNLNRCNYLNGQGKSLFNQLVEDGRFGPATERALKIAQKLRGTTPDGIYGKNTRSKLWWKWDLKKDTSKFRCGPL